MNREKLLLHSCCGPCSTSVIERLIEDYQVTVFFYNPCITEKEEYEKRKKNQILFIEAFNESVEDDKKVEFIEGDYFPLEYFSFARDYATEKEGGLRCHLCFDQRLKETARFAKDKGFSIFTTTLTVSPHKNFKVISEIGKKAANEYGVEFLEMDFKKKAGFQRSIELSKEYDLYRQDYCGCVYSKRN